VRTEWQDTVLDGLYGKVTHRIVPILLFGYIAAYLDRVNVGFAKLQMLEDLRFSEMVFGLGAGIFFLGYFLFEVPSNLLLHRFGARVWLARIMITWGLLSAAMALVETSASFYVLRFLLGVAEAGFFPGVIYYLTQWYPSGRRGSVTALFMTAIAVCTVFGSLLSGWILEVFDGRLGWAAWQWLFVLEALPAIAIGVYIFLRLPRDIASVRWLAAEEKALLTAELVRERDTDDSESILGAFRDGRVWFACLVYFCLVVGVYGIGFWLPTILSEMGFKRPLEIGMLTALPYGIAAVGMVLVGRSADRHGERRWHVAVPAGLGALGLVLSVQLASNPVLAIFGLTLATFGILSSVPLFWSLPTAELRGAAAAAGIAIINSCGNLAGFASPSVIGWIKETTGSTVWGMYYVAAFLVLGGVLTVLGFAPSCADGVPRRRSA
jgi:D-galactonate transporter